MPTRSTGTKHLLAGDWTIAGIVNHVESLSDTLEKHSSTRRKSLHVDCGRINNIDMCGLQLLHVWKNCATMRGLQVRFVNLPDGMQQTIHRLGLGQCFTDNYPDAA
jgi:anti-anti-sigma regulatory factor